MKKTKKPNILILITDQQRSIQHFPEGWAEAHLPWTTHLKKTGVTFKNNMCSSTACSPSRSTIFSSTYPTINGVLKVNDTINMSRTLPMGGSIATLGKIMTDSGYRMVYKGKWHLDSSFANFSFMRPSDMDRMMIEDDAMENHYAFPGWTSPDFGTAEANLTERSVQKPDENTPLNSIGGGFANNDHRIVNGPMFAEHQESAVDFIKNYNPEDEKPFCLVVSLANPHDVWVYPFAPDSAGYTEHTWLESAYDNFELPDSYESSLDEKPQAQQDFLKGFQRGKIKDADRAKNYLKFYAYLQTLIDDLTGDIIKAMRENIHVGDQLEKDTYVIRLSDHGEMAMSQGGLRQKENNIYKETINIPMIFSNPNLPQNVVKDDLVSLIDVLPTIADLTGATIPENIAIQGESYANTVLNGVSNERKYNFFATDDCSMSSYTCIRGIISHRYKYGVYYAADYSNQNYGIVNFNGEISASKDDENVPATEIQYELYDYSTEDGLSETTNLLNDSDNVSGDLLEIWQELHEILTTKMKETYTLPENWEFANVPSVSTE
ncbi:sulfatase-like hydrolase/transferase [Kordia jejudonensis]|uniref:sulfatase-like hydrolase/transferase n=1 Tax=Kordia jejudonensis TaxID=1348245 RepID=UPI0006295B31|nr:sulfatase-like hydrolase/transferase [Kordia jejudonensis]